MAEVALSRIVEPLFTHCSHAALDIAFITPNTGAYVSIGQSYHRLCRGTLGLEILIAAQVGQTDLLCTLQLTYRHETSQKLQPEVACNLQSGPVRSRHMQHVCLAARMRRSPSGPRATLRVPRYHCPLINLGRGLYCADQRANRLAKVPILDETAAKNACRCRCRVERGIFVLQRCRLLCSVLSRGLREIRQS